MNQLTNRALCAKDEKARKSRIVELSRRVDHYTCVWSSLSRMEKEIDRLLVGSDGRLYDSLVTFSTELIHLLQYVSEVRSCDLRIISCLKNKGVR